MRNNKLSLSQTFYNVVGDPLVGRGGDFGNRVAVGSEE